MKKPSRPSTHAKRLGDPGMICPHCESSSSIRNSQQLTAVIRQIRYRCDNDDCGHVFVAQLEVIRTCVRSAIENAGVRIPYSPRTATLPMPANDTPPLPANDDRLDAAIAGPGEPMT